MSTAEELTADALYRLTVEQRLPYDQAWEMVREEWAFPIPWHFVVLEDVGVKLDGVAPPEP